MVRVDTGLVSWFSYAARSGAGGYAQDRYAEGLTSWRRRLQRTVLPFCAPVFAAGLVIALVAPDPLQWFAGFGAAASASIYLMLRESPPQFVDKWRRGAEGERATARMLGPLRREGWQLFHDLDTGRGNRDHVAIGPAGVYLLDSKNLSGTIEVDGDVIRAHYRDYPRDDYKLDKIGSWMRSEAAKLKGEIEQLTGERVWVQSVVVIWGAFDAQPVDGDRVTFIHGEALADWLRAQPARLLPPAQQQIATALRPSRLRDAD